MIKEIHGTHRRAEQTNPGIVERAEIEQKELLSQNIKSANNLEDKE